MGLRMSCVSGVQMTRCLAFRELQLLRRHAEFIVIIANYCIFQFLDPLGSQASACAHGSQLDAYPWSSPGEAGSEQEQSWQKCCWNPMVLQQAPYLQAFYP